MQGRLRKKILYAIANFTADTTVYNLLPALLISLLAVKIIQQCICSSSKQWKLQVITEEHFPASLLIIILKVFCVPLGRTGGPVSTTAGDKAPKVEREIALPLELWSVGERRQASPEGRKDRKSPYLNILYYY